MKGVLGIIFSNMHDYMITELTAKRCMGSIPVGGRYRLIDFVLSGFANSGIEQVGVITKSNYQSLMDHLGTGREWDLTRKRGGLSILPPFGNVSSNGMYRGRVEALAGIMNYMNKSKAEYVITADCDLMANIDFGLFMQDHLDSGADISVMYKKMEVEEGGPKDICTLILDRENRALDMLIHPEITGVQNVYINVMMISREMLAWIINDCYSRNQTSFNKDVLQAGIGKYKVHAHEFDGYVGRFDSMKSFYSANMAMLDADVRRSLFPQERPIYTKNRDESPVRYGLYANVTNSLLADGCIIDGEVENSILFRGVTVAKGATVRNSIIMQDTHIGPGSSLDCVITDKDVGIMENRKIMGFSTYPVYIAKGSAV